MKFLVVLTPPSIYRGCSTRKTFWEEKFTCKKEFFLSVDMKICGRRNVRKHKKIRGSDKYVTLKKHKKIRVNDKYVTLDISSKFDSEDVIFILSRLSNFYKMSKATYLKLPLIFLCFFKVTYLSLPLISLCFVNIATTTIFHVHRQKEIFLTCVFFLPERLPSGATMINRRWCNNC